MKKLAVITTHPIQYNAPFFKLLNERRILQVKVFYTWGMQVLENKYDPGFNQVITWDIPLLNGYNYTFAENTSTDPGSHHFNGIITPALIKDVEKWGANAVLVFGWSFKSHLQLMRHFKNKITVIFRGDSNLLDESPGFTLKKTARRLFLKWIYTHVDKALYVGEANRQYFMQHGLKPNQLFFAPHAVDNNRFDTSIAEDLRTELQIPQHGFVFLITGKMEPKKNHALVIRTFAMLRDENAYLLIVGSGILEETIKSEVEGLAVGIKTRIRFLPFQNQQRMPSVYKSADVLIMASQGPGETWGLAVNEAMAASRPAIVSNKCGCAADLIQDGETGYVFESNNSQDLLTKMKLISANKCKAHLMGEHAKSTIKNWSFENLAVAIEQAVIEN